MASPETRERELRPLRMIPDNYEKIVLSMDRSYIHSYDGIKSLYLIDWLLDDRLSAYVTGQTVAVDGGFQAHAGV